MLSGDHQYQNPIYGVSTFSPSDLNEDPTVESLYEIVKELNGVGEATSGIMSETWSSRVAASIRTRTNNDADRCMPEFDIPWRR